MLRLFSSAALLGLALVIPSSAFGGDVDREIHVPRGWEPAYEYGYAPVIKFGNQVIVSGVPNAGSGSYEERTRRMYERVRGLLEAAGATFEDVLELNTFHLAPKDPASFGAEFSRFMPIHEEFFGDHRPAWTAVGTTALLSPQADVEMRVVAVVGSGSSSRVIFAKPSIPEKGDR